MTNRFQFSDGTDVRARLLSLCPGGCKEFAQKLNPGVEHVLGLRVPDMRALAREIASGDWRNYLTCPNDFYMEERMLHGLVLGQIRISDVEEYLQLVERFVRKINSWSVCDVFTFAGGRRFVSENSRRLEQWLCGWLSSDREYEVRFGVVMLLKYFITEEHLSMVLSALECVSHPAYYVRMSVAWAISECVAKFPVRTVEWLRVAPLDIATVNKAIQKSLESYRVTDECKSLLRTMRKR